MPTELRDGQTLELGSVESGDAFTYRGKPVKFELVDENTNQYQAQIKFSEEEKKAGNVDTTLTFTGPQRIEGTISINSSLPQNDNLTDAEKHTLLNSLQYQTGQPETTQIANGSIRTGIGRQALQNRKEEGLTAATNKAVQEAQNRSASNNQQVGSSIVDVEEQTKPTKSSGQANSVSGSSGVEGSDNDSKQKEQSKVQTPTKLESKK